MELIDETMRLGTLARNEYYGIKSMAWTYCGYWLCNWSTPGQTRAAYGLMVMN